MLMKGIYKFRENCPNIFKTSLLLNKNSKYSKSVKVTVYSLFRLFVYFEHPAEKFLRSRPSLAESILLTLETKKWCPVSWCTLNVTKVLRITSGASSGG